MWSFEEGDYIPSQPNTNYHHKACPCQRCKDKDPAAARAETIRRRLVVVNSTPPTKYAEGYFKTQPVKNYGAVPRLMMALARKKPDNGWAWYALAFGKFVKFEAYWPDMTYIPPTTSNTVSTK